jgi:hypothetical protein
MRDHWREISPELSRVDYDLAVDEPHRQPMTLSSDALGRAQGIAADDHANAVIA